MRMVEKVFWFMLCLWCLEMTVIVSTIAECVAEADISGIGVLSVLLGVMSLFTGLAFGLVLTDLLFEVSEQ